MLYFIQSKSFKISFDEIFEGLQETSFEERIGQQFSASPVGCILGRLEPAMHEELVQRYLYDFVAMKYCPVTDCDQEIQVIDRCVHTFLLPPHLESLSY